MLFQERTLRLPHFFYFSDVDPITLRKLNTSALDESKYFTSLEMPRKSKSRMTFKTEIPWGNIASKLFDELSHSTSTLVNLKVQQILQFQQRLTLLWLTQLTWMRSSQ